ncbi:MAG: hypothetical protein QF384_05840 [Alphaproteobacteria bacterium]|jgi:hypothetical protein|nr:hypothetical protein [Alphaproteobacteria bacterium]MDP6832755.1 hypothetical protein [Alphaproteobacteria bacterium]
MKPLRHAVIVGPSLALALVMATPAAAKPADPPSWRPVASEKLIKLPTNYLKKSLDHDFAQSALSGAIQDADSEIGLKGQTLDDLRTAIEQADGELQVELRHQFLAQKREFITLMKRKADLRRRHLQTKQRTLERLLKKLGQEKGAMTPARVQLVAQQQQARARFKGSLAKVDLAVLASPAVPESKYAQEYAANMAAAEALAAAIRAHPMNSQARQDGQPASKADFIRQMLADTQAGVAVLEQEQNVIGYMAKLVALDALALSESVMDAELTDSDAPRTAGPAAAVKYFVN